MKKPKKRATKPRPTIKQRTLLRVLEAAAPALCSRAALMQELGLHTQQERDALRHLLRAAVAENQIYRGPKGRYGLLQNNGQRQSYEGIIDHVRPSLAYVRCRGLKKDPTLRGRQLQGLFHGDKVRIRLLAMQKKEESPRAHLVEVLARARRSWVGQLRPLGEHFSFHADSARLHRSLIVHKDATQGATPKDKVSVRPLPMDGRPNTYAKVCAILGKVGLHEVEMHAILQEFDIPTRFSEAATAEAAAFSSDLSAEETQKRRDFRGMCCFTIDPADAKDFDDALSFRVLPEGGYEVGIHIADVSHYVQPGTALDQEAAERGTSVYLVDRTVPMLPERLSHGLCSLRPEEDRLAFSALFQLNEAAEVQKQWFGRSVIRSQRRFTYDEARKVLQTSKDPWQKPIQQLHMLAQSLRARRFEAGALGLHSLEFSFELDPTGRPLQLHPKIQHEAHELIEEFMLLANRRVAEYVWNCGKKKKPPLFVYRVHEPPEQEKLETLLLFAAKFGYKLRWQEEKIPHQINTMLAQAQGRPEEPLLQQLAIRAMSKAHYTTKAMPHFGLGFRHYTHFTSPIRRYPDLLVHRLLQQYLNKEAPKDLPPHEELSLHASEMERRATEAERASIKYKQAEYMLQHIGQTFQGIVSGITEWGFYVIMQPHYCEGMVRLSSLKDDYYSYHAKHLSLTGRRKGRSIILGDAVEVEVLASHPLQRKIDLAWIPHPGTRASTQRGLPVKSKHTRKL